MGSTAGGAAWLTGKGVGVDARPGTCAAVRARKVPGALRCVGDHHRVLGASVWSAKPQEQEPDQRRGEGGR